MVLSPTVTIIMPVFNEGGNLSIAVNSIILQSLKSWNLVIVDDGSTDNTRELAYAYSEKYHNIKLLVNKDNRGLSYSLNKAISQTDSEYIARMDADDIAMTGRLKSQLRFLKDHPEIDVLGTGAEVLTGHNKTIILKPENHNNILKSIEKTNPFFHSSIMMRRSFIESIGGYDNQCTRAQDYDLWLRGVDNFRYHNLQEVLMVYLSKNQSFKSIHYGLKVRVINSFRRHRVIIGSSKGVLVFIYGLWVKALRALK